MIAVTLAACLMTFVYGTIPFDEEPYRQWDLASYREMAAASPALAEGVSRHFAYRVLGPFLVGLVPASDTLSFRILTSATLVITAVAFARFLLRRGVTHASAFLASLGFVCNKHMFGYPAWNPFHFGDALAMLALVVLYGALLERRWTLFATAFVFGILARESVLLVLPAGAAMLILGANPRFQRKHALAQLGAAALPGLAVYGVLRTSLEVSGDTSFIDALAMHAPKLLRIETWLRLLVHVPAPLTLVPLVLFPRTRDFVKDHPHTLVYAGLVFGSTCFGSNDERLMGPVFIVYFWLVGCLLDGLRNAPRTRWALVPILVASSADHLYARVPLPSQTHTVWVTASTLLLATAVVAIGSHRTGGFRESLRSG